MTDWTEVAEAVKMAGEAYTTMLQVRADERAGTKKVAAAEQAFLEAVTARAAALSKNWTAEDGVWGDKDKPRLSVVLQRYYKETGTSAKKGRKKK